MDLAAAIRQLYVELMRLDKEIATLETLPKGEQVRRASRPGRKGMSDEERVQVSERMKRYWASRKNQRIEQFKG